MTAGVPGMGGADQLRGAGEHVPGQGRALTSQARVEDNLRTVDHLGELTQPGRYGREISAQVGALMGTPSHRRQDDRQRTRPQRLSDQAAGNIRQ